MEEVKNTYYVDMSSETILPEPIESTSFIIHATPKEVSVLERALERIHEKDFETYIHAHIPDYVVREYFDDPRNTQYDKRMQIIYSILYHLGNNETKEHIRGMGILTDEDFYEPIGDKINKGRP